LSLQYLLLGVIAFITSAVKTNSFYLQLLTLTVFQEDISKLRGKIEKAKKPAEKISNGDDILNEEINDYKVSLNSALEAESGIEASGCWLRVYNHMC